MIKNEIYLAAIETNDDLHDPVKSVNEPFLAPWTAF